MPSTLFWFDRSGNSLGQAAPARYYRAPRISADGKAIAVELADDRYGTRDVWLVDPASQALTRLTTNPATDWRAVFLPDRSTLAFASDRSGASTIVRVSTGGGDESVLYRHPDGGAFPYDWSRDGKHIVATLEGSNGRTFGIGLIPVEGAPAINLVDGDMGRRVAAPRLSNDGEYVAFTADITGTREVYVMSIATAGVCACRRMAGSTPSGAAAANCSF